MRKHRNPRDTVTKVPAQNNFNPSDAVEELYRAIIPLEATAKAASDASDLMPYFAGGEDRRNMARLYSLVTRFEEQAVALLARSEEMIDTMRGRARNPDHFPDP